MADNTDSERERWAVGLSTPHAIQPQSRERVETLEYVVAGSRAEAVRLAKEQSDLVHSDLDYAVPARQVSTATYRSGGRR